MSERLRVLVVDDSLVFRKLVSEALGGLPDVEVIGTASDGKAAISRVRERQPDLITLDVEMPEMDGLSVLEQVRARWPEVGVLMVSAHTVRGGERTIRALELGAFDFVTKPDQGDLEANRASLATSLRAILQAYAARHHVRGMLRKMASSPHLPAPLPPPPAPAPEPSSRADLVLIGLSTGGPTALAAVVPALPQNLPAPVIIVQHMPPVFTRSLAASLDAKSALQVKEADDGDLLAPGAVYLAPGGKQLRLVVSPSGERRLRVTDDPPEHSCKPAVDYLFRSVANQGVKNVLAVVMTGMGKDGTVGARLLKRIGARIVAQDEATSVVFGMPKSAIDAGVVDKVCALGEIAAEIRRAAQG